MISFSSKEICLRLDSGSGFLLNCYMYPNFPLQHVIVTRHGVYVYTASPVPTLIRGKAIVWLFISLESFSHQLAVCIETFHQGKYHRIRAEEVLEIPRKKLGELLVHFHAKIKLWKSKRFILLCKYLSSWPNIQIFQNSCRPHPLPAKTYICKWKAMFSTSSSSAWKVNFIMVYWKFVK